MKQYKSLYLSIFIILASNISLVAQDLQEDLSPEFVIHEDTQTVTVHNKSFELFLSAIVEEAITAGKKALLSEAMLRCYECIKNQKDYAAKDLQEAMPQLLAIANMCCDDHKAPRPGLPTPENEIVGPGTCDLGNVINLLNQILIKLNVCCSSIQGGCGCIPEFQQTWTILAAISPSGCGCIPEFQQTWTILGAEFNGTFSSIAAISSPCNATPITAPVIISLPGYYCLANDIVGTLTITASDVTVDLNNHTISAPGTVGIFLSGATNAIVQNGKINDTAIGIELSLTITVKINDLLITDCSAFGIAVVDICSGLVVQNSVIDTSFVGITSNNCLNSQFNATIIRNTEFPISGTYSNSIFQNIQIIDCGGAGATAFAIGSSGNNNKIISCSIINFQGGAGFNIGSNNTVLEECTIQDIFSATSVVAISFSGINGFFKNCSALNIQSVSGSIGFQIENSTLENCLVQTCSSTSLFNANTGFSLIDNSNAINCQVYESAGYGFFINGAPNVILQNCEAAYNGIDGFLLDTLTTLVGNCTAFKNAGRGFNVNVVGTIPMYSCFASGNVVANYVNAPNVVAAATAGAFENAFI